MKVFVDTCILLDFYQYTSEELEELRKVIGLIENDRLEVLTTQQVKDEFGRNRDSVLQKMLGEMQNLSIKYAFPAATKGLDGYAGTLEATRDVAKKYNELRQQFQEAARARSLSADVIVSQFFKAAKTVPISEKAFAAADRRKRLGNPPQKTKDNSLGDALNWEAIVEHWGSEDWDDLHIVSKDGDFADPMDSSRIHPFLAEEWSKGRIFSFVLFYPSLSVFFKKHFPHVKLASEISVHILLDELNGSRSFAQTHAAVAKLSLMGVLPLSAVERIVSIVEENSQVGLIKTDKDVHTLLRDCLNSNGTRLKQEIRSKLSSWVVQGAVLWPEEKLAEKPSTKQDF